MLHVTNNSPIHLFGKPRGLQRMELVLFAICVCLTNSMKSVASAAAAESVASNFLLYNSITFTARWEHVTWATVPFGFGLGFGFGEIWNRIQHIMTWPHPINELWWPGKKTKTKRIFSMQVLQWMIYISKESLESWRDFDHTQKVFFFFFLAMGKSVKGCREWEW